MIDLYYAARERGKYEAIGGHKAGWGGAYTTDVNGQRREACSVCRRPLTWRGDRHAPNRRRRRR